jgi:hypothetical protein
VGAVQVTALRTCATMTRQRFSVAAPALPTMTRDRQLWSRSGDLLGGKQTLGGQRRVHADPPAPDRPTRETGAGRTALHLALLRCRGGRQRRALGGEAWRRVRSARELSRRSSRSAGRDRGRGGLVPALRRVIPGVEELLAERGVEVDHVTVYRWVPRFTPLLVDAARPYRHAAGGRWFVDETYVKVAGVWRYVDRAVDRRGQVLDVVVSKRRDT